MVVHHSGGYCAREQRVNLEKCVGGLSSERGVECGGATLLPTACVHTLLPVRSLNRLNRSRHLTSVLFSAVVYVSGMRIFSAGVCARVCFLGVCKDSWMILREAAEKIMLSTPRL
jgi:hypothetical protein